MNEKRGIWMAGKLAEKQINKAVGCAYLPNNKNIAQQNSSGSESLHSEKTALTPLSTLTTAPYGAVTRMNRAFAGGGGI